MNVSSYPPEPAGAREESAPDFLRGGGEMGARMRAHDWSATSLGPPAGWPQPLRTVVRALAEAGRTAGMGLSIKRGQIVSFLSSMAPAEGKKASRPPLL